MHAIPLLLPDDQQDLFDEGGLEMISPGEGRPAFVRRVPDARLERLWARQVVGSAPTGPDLFAVRDDPSTTWMSNHLLVAREVGPRPAAEPTAARAIVSSFDGRRVHSRMLRALSADKPRLVALSHILLSAAQAWSTPRGLGGRLEALAEALGWSPEADYRAEQQAWLTDRGTYGVVWLATLWQGAHRQPRPALADLTSSCWAESIAPVAASAQPQGPDFVCAPIEIWAARQK